ncbi:HlyD family efflux transporter periplasmic adaptor subunit [Simiduia curdlanivorans]|uniref:Efflux RND transporter periplasmic adaptor subunit n=1 Tax=Simiduia curdlanivorans TaxID=1492769 RepID=A0ABV8V1L0_9GAMM|nr:HlyD family efflux transporter periplasmic adaptor subunit [Simiduia curdlanivorans]MDN3639140.1 HlyD family efflux transporter periplasmic adaptor subunit [Simiduia curdlanivorans]
MFIDKFKDKRVYLPFVIVITSVLALVIMISLKQPPEEKEADQVAPLVKVEPIRFEPMQLDVNSHGLVTPKFKTQLVAQISGEISFIAPEFVRGGFVKQGQILARINDSDYQAYVIEARAALLSAKAGLQQEQALGAVAKDEWSRIKDRKPTALSLREPQLAQEQARVHAAEAALARAESNLERTIIRAPFHALIESRQVSLGSYVNPGNAVGEALSVSEAEVRLPVADNQLKFLINEGVGAKVILRGELQGQQTSWEAKIIRTEGVIDNQSRMAYLVAELVNPYGLQVPKPGDQTLSQATEHPLRFGSYVRAEVEGISLPQAALVPRHLIVDGKVPTLTAEHTLLFKPVTSLREQGTMVVVVDGVSDQDQLIVSALQYPVEGMPLRLPSEKKASVEKPNELNSTESTEQKEALAKKSD